MYVILFSWLVLVTGLSIGLSCLYTKKCWITGRDTPETIQVIEEIAAELIKGNRKIRHLTEKISATACVNVDEEVNRVVVQTDKTIFTVKLTKLWEVLDRPLISNRRLTFKWAVIFNAVGFFMMLTFLSAALALTFYG